MSPLENVALRRAPQERPWRPVSGQLTVGKDILELLSAGMYVDPMSVYREYIQNSADAIDDARAAGLLSDRARGKVEINIDLETRTVRVRDNGIGIPAAEFVERLTAFGASQKRGKNSRGFRGVGRLAGIGYCQELLFRTRAAGEGTVSELRWDCRQLKSLLRSQDYEKQLRDVVFEAVAVRSKLCAGYPEHFFEVELRSIVRHRNDRLLDTVAVNDYLAQVGPLPFAPEFKYGSKIREALVASVKLGELEIWISGFNRPAYRPHRDHIEVGSGNPDAFRDLEIIEVPGLDGGIAAIAWVLHHGYAGALPTRTLQKGLRLRVGNIQVGDDRMLEDLFLEPRFNSWCVGEVHIIDPRIVPNGRRDHFEHNSYYLNVITHLVPLARNLSKMCRGSSMRRNRRREFVRRLETARESIAIIKQGSLSRTEQARLLRSTNAAISEAEQLCGSDLFLLPQDLCDRDLHKLKRDLAKLGNRGDRAASAPLAHLPRAQQQTYQHIFALIYECAPNRTVAKAIVDRIITRL